jgi:hypothetical protein
MNNYDNNLDFEKHNNKTKNTKNIYQSNNTEQFNSFKYKHFNNYYYNIINEQLKKHHINNNFLNKNDKQISSLIKNELLHKTLIEKLFINPNINYNNANKTAFSYYENKKILEKEKSEIDNFYKKKFNSSTDNRHFTKNALTTTTNYKNQKKNYFNNNTKYINKDKGQNTIPNILTNQIEKNKNSINSRNDSFMHSEYNNKSLSEENNKYSKTSESNYLYRYKMQQLPKDAVNGLLLFLKKNKKHLARTSKYYNIYKNYKKLIDNFGLENDSVSESKSIKKNNNNKVNKGYYGRKPLDGVDIFDISSTYRNKYNNKSEKNRHELILGELNKLKGYIEKNKNEKMLFIKDFLNKHNINYDDNNQLIAFDNFINSYNKNQIASILKPYLGIKEMILDIMKEGEKINLINKYNEKKNHSCFSTNNIHNSNKKNDNNNNNGNNTNYKFYENKISKSPYMILNNKTELNFEQKNKCMNQKLNIVTINSDNIYNKQKAKKNKPKPFDFDLYETNSYLKDMGKQIRLHYPKKDYSSNYNLIIEEIGGELKKISEKIKNEKKYKFREAINSKQNKKKPIKINNINNFNFITQSSNSSIDDIFITSNKNLSENNKLNENIYAFNESKENNKNKIKIVKRTNKQNFSLNNDNNNNINNNNKRKMNKKMTQIIIKKLNLRPKINLIEVEDVKKRLKLTEYIVFNNARRKLMFEELGKNELYEYVNNNKINK